jgi:predicted amino acid racemase
MNSTAVVSIDLAKISANARRVVAHLPGIDLVAVTKVTGGSPEVGQALVDGGATALGDSRLGNLARLRAAGIRVPLWLLRAPTPEQAAETVAVADISLESELETLRALSRAAGEAGRRHAVVIMVDLGDLREGILPVDVPAFLDTAEKLAYLDVVGIGVNLTCYGAIMPDEHNLGQLAELAAQAEHRLGRSLLVSGGNSGSLDMAITGRMPAAINTLRIGETILLGVNTLTREPMLDLHGDAFTVAAAVIECKVKPSLPTGTIAQDAFGNRPTFTDHGLRRRAICALGRQDVLAEGLKPLDPRVRVLGASSDHLILDVEDLATPPAIGDFIEFVPGYGALLQLFTSPYVDKVFIPPA